MACIYVDLIPYFPVNSSSLAILPVRVDWLPPPLFWILVEMDPAEQGECKPHTSMFPPNQSSSGSQQAKASSALEALCTQ